MHVESSGEREVARARGGTQLTWETWSLELEYRELPGDAEATIHSTSTLVLGGLRYRSQLGEPSQEREIQLADDRLRMLEDGKVTLDLEGAQPREPLTPRMLLQRPFAQIRYDRRGNPLAVFLGGLPGARELLDPLPLRASLAWTRLAFPEATPPGDGDWRARRFPVTPAGSLGLPVELHYRVIEVGASDRARIRIQGHLEGTDVPSELGFRFDRALARVRGEACLEVPTSRVRWLELESDVRAQYRRGPDGERVRHRLRHQSHSRLAIRDGEESPGC
jgi:hypothetical protein